MRRSHVRVLAVLLAIALSAALGACGRAIGNASTPPAQSLTPGACPGSSPTADSSAGLLGSEKLRAMPVTTLPPGVTVGQVRVVVESGAYDRGSTIFAWAGNGLGQCIYATDHHSDCSIIVLERQVDSGWQPQADCQLATPTRTLALPPMQADFVRLAPPATGAQPGIWQAGTYRVAFSYHLGQDATGQPIAVVSDPFTVT